MNVVITLPSRLIDKILSGEKTFEMRKGNPFHFPYGLDGFFVVEKGTNKVRCFCFVDYTMQLEPWECPVWYPELCVSDLFIRKYVKKAKSIFLWHIGHYFPIRNFTTSDLGVKRNPQSYVYTNHPPYFII